MFKRIFGILLSIAIIGGLSFLIVHNIRAGIAKKNKEFERQRKLSDVDQRFLVEIKKVRRQSISKSIELSGTITPSAKATVFSMVPGVINKMKVEEGDTVVAGETLAKLERWKMTLAHHQAKAVLNQARLGLQNMKINYNRLKKLYAKDAIPKADFEKVDIGYKMAQQRVSQAQAAVSMASAAWSDATIKAPISGTVIMKLAEKGDLMTASQAMKMSPLLVIANLDKVKLEVHVIEKYIGLITVGMKARVNVDAYKNTFYGKVTKIGEMIDPLTRTLKVEITLDNKERIVETIKDKRKMKHPLKVGMYSRVFLLLDHRKNRIVIPSDAVLKEINREFVFLYKDGKAKKVWVKVGITDNDRVEIVKGINEGDSLITIGHRSLHDDQSVRVMKTNPFIHNTERAILANKIEVKQPASKKKNREKVKSGHKTVKSMKKSGGKK